MLVNHQPKKWVPKHIISSNDRHDCSPVISTIQVHMGSSFQCPLAFTIVHQEAKPGNALSILARLDIKKHHEILTHQKTSSFLFRCFIFIGQTSLKKSSGTLAKTMK
jgi:hypothetical protein